MCDDFMGGGLDRRNIPYLSAFVQVKIQTVAPVVTVQPDKTGWLNWVLIDMEGYVFFQEEWLFFQ